MPKGPPTHPPCPVRRPAPPQTTTEQPLFKHGRSKPDCGNGNFTAPLAQNFRNVVATEVAKASVDAARYNMEVGRPQTLKP